MKHAREDYNQIQDMSGKIPEDEPVFVIRAQDISSIPTLQYWAYLNEIHGGDMELSRRVIQHAELMREWQVTHTVKPADL